MFYLIESKVTIYMCIQKIKSSGIYLILGLFVSMKKMQAEEEFMGKSQSCYLNARDARLVL